MTPRTLVILPPPWKELTSLLALGKLGLIHFGSPVNVGSYHRHLRPTVLINYGHSLTHPLNKLVSQNPIDGQVVAIAESGCLVQAADHS